ncbi:hypothetical protein H2248_010426 [Termitomyces sp. 'cryptogamus']|nr:hypothetical protein H2248_010426 [Termitomyces sp. 'cryptogamus']
MGSIGTVCESGVYLYGNFLKAALIPELDQFKTILRDSTSACFHPRMCSRALIQEQEQQLFTYSRSAHVSSYIPRIVRTIRRGANARRMMDSARKADQNVVFHHRHLILIFRLLFHDQNHKITTKE